MFFFSSTHKHHGTVSRFKAEFNNLNYLIRSPLLQIYMMETCALHLKNQTHVYYFLYWHGIWSSASNWHNESWLLQFKNTQNTKTHASLNNSWISGTKNECNRRSSGSLQWILLDFFRCNPQQNEKIVHQINPEIMEWFFLVTTIINVSEQNFAERPIMACYALIMGVSSLNSDVGNLHVTIAYLFR